MMIKVFLVDDEVLLRESLATILGFEEDLEVVDQAGDGYEAIKKMEHLSVDVVVMDLEMPHMSGFKAAKYLLNNNPETKILLLTRHARPGLLKRSLDLGVKGFATKVTKQRSLPRIIREIFDGNTYVDPTMVAASLTAEPCPLTERECEVLDEAQSGALTQDIAKELYLAPGTVRNILSSAISKLGVETRQQAVNKAFEHGWI